MTTINWEFLHNRPLSFTSFFHFTKAPALYQYYLDKEDEEDTDALIVGKVLHSMVLEPEKAKELYACIPECDGRTTEGKKIKADFIAANEGKEHIPYKLYKQAEGMANSIRNNSQAMTLIKHGTPEYKIQFDYNGLPFVGYIDFLGCDEEGNVTHKVELKTVQSGVYRKIQNDFYDKGYHIQNGIYDTALPTPDSYYIWVEKKPPYLSGVFRASDDYIRRGKLTLRQKTEDFKDCLEKGDFSGGYEFWVGNEIQELDLPGWLK